MAHRTKSAVIAAINLVAVLGLSFMSPSQSLAFNNTPPPIDDGPGDPVTPTDPTPVVPGNPTPIVPTNPTPIIPTNPDPVVPSNPTPVVPVTPVPTPTGPGPDPTPTVSDPTPTTPTVPDPTPPTPNAAGGSGNPNVTPRFGPSLPYISGRLGRAQSPTEPPVGTVVPDDFCLPGKFEDCGSHLRDAGDFAPVPQDGPVFVTAGGYDPFGTTKHAIWINGQSRQTDMTFFEEYRNLNTLSFGGDRLIGNSMLLGVMVMGTNATTEFRLSGITDTERGIFVGPYFAYQLSDSLLLDGQFVLGTVDHTIATGAVTSGQFNSLDTAASIRISGSYDLQQWRLHPSFEIANTSSARDAYVDTVSGAVAATSGSETYLTLAMLSYYNGLTSGRSGIHPYVGFEASQQLGNGGLFGTIRVGGSMVTRTGAVINLDYSYGAIGLENIDDQLISLRLEIPL